MKILPILLLSSLIILTAAQAEDSASIQESRKPTWIERLFGINGESGETPKDKDGRKEAEAEEELAEKVKEHRKFTPAEREVLESWQKGNAGWKKSKKPLPPGLQKKVDRGGELPPGWKKKLEVGAILDPEVDAATESIPEEILKRLPESEAGAEIIRVGSQIIKVIEGSREIVDILDGATDENGSAED